jgi:large subunit ribosomal protein L19e
MAASLMKVGQSRLWINPEETEKVEAAITKNEIRRLIHEGVIAARQKSGVSRGRHRIKIRKKTRKGPGSKKGSTHPHKRPWINKIRVLRARLKELKAKRIITKQVYGKLRLMAKGGAFRSKSHLNEYLEAHNLGRRR